MFYYVNNLICVRLKFQIVLLGQDYQKIRLAYRRIEFFYRNVLLPRYNSFVICFLINLHRLLCLKLLVNTPCGCMSLHMFSTD